MGQIDVLAGPAGSRRTSATRLPSRRSTRSRRPPYLHLVARSSRGRARSCSWYSPLALAQARASSLSSQYRARTTHLTTRTQRSQLSVQLVPEASCSAASKTAPPLPRSSAPPAPSRREVRRSGRCWGNDLPTGRDRSRGAARSVFVYGASSPPLCEYGRSTRHSSCLGSSLLRAADASLWDISWPRWHADNQGIPDARAHHSPDTCRGG
jgi:hypothetical protein